MVDYDEVGYCCGKHEIELFLFNDLWSNFSFEQSTRKCKWEPYDGQAKFLDTIKAKQVMGQKMGCGSQLVDLFVKQRKDMREFAR